MRNCTRAKVAAAPDMHSPHFAAPVEGKNFEIIKDEVRRDAAALYPTSNALLIKTISGLLGYRTLPVL